MKLWYFLSIIFFLYIEVNICSLGDRAPRFRNCVFHCGEFFSNHHLNSNEFTFYHPNPVFSRLLRWDINAECKYQCMHLCEYFRSTNSSRPLQYFGKWPFYRIFGIQEFFSVFFSLLNLYAHNRSYEKVKLILFTSPMYKYYFIVSSMTWISSAIFHARDTPLTEFFDYALSFAGILFSLFIAIDRVFLKKRGRLLRWTLASFLSLIWIIHYYRMAMISFDYALNMTLNLMVGVAHSLIWAYWAFKHHIDLYPFKPKIILFCILISIASLFEVYDFPPILNLIDAHALWHASTVFLIPLYWSFLSDEYGFDTLLALKFI